MWWWVGGGLSLLGHSRRVIAFISEPVQEAVNVRGIFEVGRSFFSCFPNSFHDCWHVAADEGTHPITLDREAGIIISSFIYITSLFPKEEVYLIPYTFRGIDIINPANPLAAPVWSSYVHRMLCRPCFSLGFTVDSSRPCSAPWEVHLVNFVTGLPALAPGGVWPM